MLCLGNGASTKEFHFLTLGVKLILSDLSMAEVLAAMSTYDLGELAYRAAFHAMDATFPPALQEIARGCQGYLRWRLQSVHPPRPCFETWSKQRIL